MSIQTVWPFRHLGLKIWSVVLAVLLWMVVAGEQTVERGLRVPLELQQFPAGLGLLGEAPSLIDVRVRGDSSALSRVNPGDIVAVLDLRTARPGRRLYQITPEQVRAPFGVQVVQVTPSGLALVFETTATRQVPVVPSLEGDPAPGFVVGKVTISPAKVDVIGPESAVERAKEALTEPVSVTGAHENVTNSVTIGFQDPVLRLKTARQATVNVTIVPGPLERTVDGRPVRLLNLGANLLARSVPPTIGVILRGTRQGLDRVDPDDVVASVDLAGLGVGDYTLAVHVEASQTAGVERIVPPTVQLKITSAKP